jgi:hypothetical protein
METNTNTQSAHYTHVVVYWNYKVHAWRKKGFTNEADASEFFNVRMTRALKTAPVLSNGYTSMVQALTPKMHTV